MNKRFTKNDIIITTRGEKNKNIITPEDFEKELPARKKKPKTYIYHWEEIIKIFIEIDLDIRVMSDFIVLTEKYINTFSEIEYLVNTFYSQIRKMEGIIRYEKKLEKETLSEYENKELEKRREEFDNSVDEYMEYLYKISNISFQLVMSLEKFNPKEVIEFMTPFLIIYSHANTLKEIILFLDNFNDRHLRFTEAWDENKDFFRRYFFVPENSKSNIKKYATQQIKKKLNFQKKEFKNLNNLFLENVRRAFNENS